FALQQQRPMPGMQPGMHPGMHPGMQPGMHPGMQAGYGHMQPYAAPYPMQSQRAQRMGQQRSPQYQQLQMAFQPQYPQQLALNGQGFPFPQPFEETEIPPELRRYMAVSDVLLNRKEERDSSGYIAMDAPLDVSDKVSGYTHVFKGKSKHEPSRYDRLILRIIPLIPRSLPREDALVFVAQLLMAFDEQRAYLHVFEATDWDHMAAEEFLETAMSPERRDKPLKRTVRRFLKDRIHENKVEKKKTGKAKENKSGACSSIVDSASLLPLSATRTEATHPSIPTPQRAVSRVLLDAETRRISINTRGLVMGHQSPPGVVPEPEPVVAHPSVSGEAVSYPETESESESVPAPEAPQSEGSDDSYDWVDQGPLKPFRPSPRQSRGQVQTGSGLDVEGVARLDGGGCLHDGLQHAALRRATEEVMREVRDMLRNGVIERVDSAQVSVGLFLVDKPKAPGQYRPIVDLRYTNRYMQKQRFRLLAFQALEALRPKDWPFMRVDLRKGYWQVLIRPEDRQFTGIRVGGVTYVHRALCFGASVAPVTFQSITEELARLVVRKAGVGVIIVYLDDFLLLAPSVRELLLLRGVFNDLCARCGAILALDKSDSEPMYRGVWLGTGVDTKKGLFYVDPDKATSLLSLLRPMVSKGVTTQGKLRSLVGKLTFCHRAYAPALVHTKLLLSLLVRGERDSAKVPLLPQHIARVHHWIRTLKGGASRSFLTPPFTAVITTDAATGEEGRKAGLGGQLRIGERTWSFSEPFPDSHSGAHINVLEAQAILRAVRLWASKLRGRGVVIRSDNSTAVHCINRGGSRAPRVQEVAEDIWQQAAAIDCRFVARHVAGQLNVGADIASRFRVLEGATPEAVIRQMEERWGTLEVDRFASLDNHRFRLFQTRQEDALTWDWRGWRNFVAPPWSLLGEVVTALAEWVRPPSGDQRDQESGQYHLDPSMAVVLTPRWERQPWFALLRRLAVDWLDLEVQDGGEWDRRYKSSSTIPSTVGAVRKLYRGGEDNSPSALFSERRVRELVSEKVGRVQGNTLTNFISDLRRGAKALGTALPLPEGFVKAAARAANDAIPMRFPREKHAYSVSLVQAFVCRIVEESGGVEAAAASKTGRLALLATMALGTAARVGDLLKLQQNCVRQVDDRSVRFVLRGVRSAKADHAHEGEVGFMRFPIWGQVDTWALFVLLWRDTPPEGLLFHRGQRRQSEGGIELAETGSAWAEDFTTAAKRLGLIGQGERIQVHGFRRGALLGFERGIWGARPHGIRVIG
ncbi:DNA N-6-adenine-methyltransferase, partial [Kipferlia bialata]